jgi:hypothetical protein
MKVRAGDWGEVLSNEEIQILERPTRMDTTCCAPQSAESRWKGRILL